ncbi:MAG TPA: tRNA-specific adenosine deaminase [Sphaerochaeta sp.]|jgi:tRNA(Arg) A34 adenosine deaminase TadA|nr:tRNA-specific adenosine deaminase [Sphaerochaeta sp.]
MPRITKIKPTEDDIRLLGETVRIAHQAKLEGSHPFGALLADKDGNILLEQGNAHNEGGPAMHAEIALMLKAGKLYTPEFLSECTLYSTAEPCVMCTGSMYWTNVKRLVFGISEEHLLSLTGSDEQNPTFNLPADKVLEHGQKDIEIVGPVTDAKLIEAIVADHLSFWNR